VAVGFQIAAGAKISPEGDRCMSNNSMKVREVYDAFAKGDMPTVLGAMDPQIDWREPDGLAPALTSQVGPDAVLQNIFATIGTLWSAFTVDATEILDAGDVVVGLGVYRAVGRDTGSELLADFAHVWRFNGDGKIAGFRTCTDTHLWREALGLTQPGGVTSGAPAQ
jgi:ketosteroid isomerase-like protein